MLSPADADTLANSTPREQTRKFATATQLAFRQMQWPSATLLFYSDADNGTGGRDILRMVFDPSGPEFKEWDQTGNPRKRGDLMRRAMTVMADDSLAFLDGRPATPVVADCSPRSNVSSTAATPFEHEKSEVAPVFGRATAEQYPLLSKAERLEVWRLMAIARLAFMLVPEP
jgi:hypothetical protein